MFVPSTGRDAVRMFAASSVQPNDRFKFDCNQNLTFQVGLFVFEPVRARFNTMSIPASGGSAARRARRPRLHCGPRPKAAHEAGRAAPQKKRSHPASFPCQPCGQWPYFLPPPSLTRPLCPECQLPLGLWSGDASDSMSALASASQAASKSQARWGQIRDGQHQQPGAIPELILPRSDHKQVSFPIVLRHHPPAPRFQGRNPCQLWLLSFVA